MRIADTRHPPRHPEEKAGASPGLKTLFLVIGAIVGVIRVCGLTSNDEDRTDPRKILRELEEKYGHEPSDAHEERMRKIREKFDLPPPVEPSRPSR